MAWRSLASAAWKTLLVVHRYLGAAVALLMLLWCLSGFVMMYHGYPRLQEAERLRALEPVRITGPCGPAALGLVSTDRLAGFSLEMLAGRPMLHLRLVGVKPATFDLSRCARMATTGLADAAAVATRFAERRGIAEPPRDRGVAASDQWTVDGASGRGPVRRFSFDDPAHTDIYIAQRTGQVAQVTTRADRVLGWLGAVPHWLYPTLLRRNGELWSQVVIWTSLAGTFLTATGLYVGIARLRPYRSGRWSPYRDWFYWHHMLGLVFGVLTLTWVASGLLTMNPWGLLDSPASGEWRRRLAGAAPPATEVTRFLAAVAERPGDAVRYEAADLQGRLFVVARAADGVPTRLDEEARPVPLTPKTLEAALVATGARAPVARLDREDAYYYGGYDLPAPLPVLRARRPDHEATALYFDPVSGVVLRAIDRSERISRWTRTALHDWDIPGLRRRPLWDALVLLLLAGVTAACATGAWMALRRIWRDAIHLRAQAAWLHRLVLRRR